MEQVAESGDKRVCPQCDFEASSAAEEVAHMTAAHPDIIAERLREAGIETVDYRSGPDLPSIMTLTEFRQMMVFIEHYAAPLATEDIEIGILVRDRGRVPHGETGITASWIEFSVGKRQFAMWRANMDLYEVDLATGAVHDEPLHRNG
jgi:hypothetical protein